MNRRRICIALAAVAVLGSGAPALANNDDTNSRICVNATHDKNNPGNAPICVWIPIDPR